MGKGRQLLEHPKDAQRFWIIFGDGHLAELVDMREFQEQGEWYVEMQFEPEKELLDEISYWTPELLCDNRYTISWIYPRKHVLPADIRYYRGRIIILCGMFGDPTKLTELHKDMMEEQRQLQSEIKRLYMRISFLEEQNKMAMARVEQAVQHAERITGPRKPENPQNEQMGSQDFLG
jgi:hypothetical protein